jgi:hypothetical protein
MTHALTIHSPFNDLSELVEGLSPFYTGEHLVVRAPNDVPQGEWIRFEIMLTDGTPGLAGVGRHAGTNDNGEDFGAERFDVYLGELQIEDGRSEVIWERIVLAFQQTQGGDQPTGEIDISQLEAAQASRSAVEPVSDDTAAEDAGFADLEAEPVSSQASQEFAAEEDLTEALEEPPAPVAARAAPVPVAPRAAARAAAPPAAPARPRGVLARPSLPASWAPTAEAPEPGPSNGYFAYGDRGLPVPAKPPRPEGDVRRIEPAPRPAAS